MHVGVLCYCRLCIPWQVPSIQKPQETHSYIAWYSWSTMENWLMHAFIIRKYDPCLQVEASYHNGVNFPEGHLVCCHGVAYQCARDVFIHQLVRRQSRALPYQVPKSEGRQSRLRYEDNGHLNCVAKVSMPLQHRYRARKLRIRASMHQSSCLLMPQLWNRTSYCSSRSLYLF